MIMQSLPWKLLSTKLLIFLRIRKVTKKSARMACSRTFHGNVLLLNTLIFTTACYSSLKFSVQGVIETAVTIYDDLQLSNEGASWGVEGAMPDCASLSFEESPAGAFSRFQSLSLFGFPRF